MAINFPDSPTPNDTFTDGGRTWVWDGTTWKIYSSTASGIGLNQLSVTNASVGTSALSYNNTTGVFTYTPPDLSGYITSQYTLPTASTTVLGGVKVDGSSINIDANGVISGASTYTLPTASTTVLGGVKIDGTTITINNGVISGASSVPTSITVANESTDTECFPLFSKDATGDIAPKTVTSLKLNSSSGQLEAGSFKKTGGSSSEFLKADGSIDSTSYSTFSGSYTDLTNKPTLVSNLNDLGDVNTTGVANGKILKYDLSTTSWIIADDSGGSGSGGGNVAVGSIMIWSGATNQIPTGWQLCDGTNGSPDLRDKFVIGAGNNYNVDDTGGSTTETVNISGSDTVNISASDNVTISGTTGTVQQTGGSAYTSMYSQANHTHSFSGSATVNITASDTVNISGSDTVNTLPPYYALCYIYCTAAGSNQSFIGLDDTPLSFTADKWLKVNSGGTALEWADAPSGGGTTINNNADNRIITGSSSATELNAESSLTYDGNILNFGDDKKIRYGSNFRMEMYADSTTGYLKMPADGSGAFPLEIHSGSSEVIKIDDGNTQILTGIKDKDGDLGSAGQILSSTGTQVNWIDAPTGGSGGGNVAVGSIMIWSGATNNIPTGWQLCDGTNGSPDLRDKFVVGAGNSYAVDATGGSTTSTGAGSVSFGPAGSGNASTAGSSSATVSITVDTLPPYYALCYIYCTSSGSNQTFVGLDDTPSSFTADKWLKVNSGGTALEWASAPSGSLELVTSSVLSADAITIRYDSTILQTDTIYRMVGILEVTGTAYGGFNMNPSFYDTSTNTQYGQAFQGQSNTAYSSPANHESICGPFTPVPTSNQFGLQNAVWYDEQGSLSWWLRTDQQNNIAITGMYFVAEFSTYLGPWMHMTFGSMNNRYHTGTFTGGWNLNPMSTYINNMQYSFVGGGQQIKSGSKIWLYKYV